MTRLHGTKDFWLGGLRAEAAAFAAAVAQAPPDAPVPSCPGWTVTDLVHHLGSCYEWVTALVQRGGTERPEKRESEGESSHETPASGHPGRTLRGADGSSLHPDGRDRRRACAPRRSGLRTSPG